MSVAMLKEELKNLVFFFLVNPRYHQKKYGESMEKKKLKEKDKDKILTTKATSANISLPSSPVPKNVIRAYT